MKSPINKLRLVLRTFALGLAVVWLVHGIKLAHQDIDVELPKATDTDVVYVTLNTPYRSPVADRDMSLYEFGGKVEICDRIVGHDQSQCLSAREDGRKFIYDHWRSKIRGYITVDFPCADCSPTEHFFIEPDKNQEWHVVIFLEDGRFGFIPRGTASNLKYVKADEIDLIRESVPKVLSFWDEHGKEIDSF